MSVAALRRVGWALAAAFVAIGLADRAFPPDLTPLDDLAVVVEDRSGAPLRLFPNEAGRIRLPARTQAVDPLYVDMLIAAEDRRFFSHIGVDPIAIARAASGNWRAGAIRSGASTITMQLARLLEPRPRNLLSKAVEALRAMQIERRMGKTEILSAYLTLAPYGGDLEGVEAASFAYLGKTASQLTPGEAATLVALPRSPEALRPDRDPVALRKARDEVLARAVRRGVISETDRHAAVAEPAPSARRPWPFHAPHAARALRAQGASGRIRSTIDADWQRRIEAILGAAKHELPPSATASAVIMEAKTGAVRAYAGSAAFLDTPSSGQMDLAAAIRSPGSALKPFIYAMAFEDGIAGPQTRIYDGPRDFGGWRPKNYESDFVGDVSVGEALRLSLNGPAVAILERLGARRFLGRLTDAGAAVIVPGDGPGLALALGGAGISLRDLVRLYAALGAEGRMPVAHWLETAPAPPPKRLLAAESARLTASVLRADPMRPHLAYKTGTSASGRDAWAIAIHGEWALGVWVGRADGGAVPGASGGRLALPVLHMIADQLPKPSTPPTVTTAGAAIARFGRTPDNLPERAPPLRFVFPGDGAVLARSESRLRVTAEASGGAAPYQWLLNGAPVVRTEAPWAQLTLDGHGQQRLTVVDADGRSAAVGFWSGAVKDAGAPRARLVASSP